MLNEEGLGMSISPTVTKQLSFVLGGHFGFWAQSMRAIYEKFKTEAKRSRVSDVKILQYLRSKEFLDNVQRFRARPQVLDLSPIEKSWLVMLLLHNRAPIPLLHSERAAVYSLMQKGILFYADAPLEQGFILLADRIEFISPLVALICFVQLFGSQSRTSFVRNDAKIPDFIPKVVECMDSRALQVSFGRGIDARLLERVWQMEFYRSAVSLTTRTIC